MCQGGDYTFALDTGDFSIYIYNANGSLFYSYYGKMVTGDIVIRSNGPNH